MLFNLRKKTSAIPAADFAAMELNPDEADKIIASGANSYISEATMEYNLGRNTEIQSLLEKIHQN
ncbi:MAG: hypothetical protein IKS48_08510 [Eubacterium sp.]|nr:hypothetical protein [Eubacterium sp.]